MEDDPGNLSEHRPPGAQSEAPRCATHSDQQAEGTCERCGNFVCSLCTGQGRHRLCPSCRERLGLVEFPLSRDRWSFEELLAHSWRVWKREWVWITVAMLILMGVSYGLALVFGFGQVVLVEQLPEPIQVTAGPVFTGVGQVIQVLIQGWLQLGLFALCLDVLGGRPARIARVFGEYPKLGKLILQWLTVAVVGGVALSPVIGAGVWIALSPEVLESTAVIVALVAVGLLVTVVAVYVGLGLMFMQMELVYDEAVGPVEAIRRSWVIARGQRGWLLLVALVAGAITFVGLAACCVGIVVTAGIGQLLMVAFYLALRNGADVPAPTRSLQSPLG